MKTVYYYLSGYGPADSEGKHQRFPVITVCLVQDDNGIVSRGIAICSAYDQFKKSTGRKIALARALVATRQQKNYHPVRNVYASRGHNVIASALARLMSYNRENIDLIVEARDNGTVLQGFKAIYNVGYRPLCKKEGNILKHYFNVDPASRHDQDSEAA